MKPILFNTDMVRAIQDGRKTVTRRVIKYSCLARPTRTLDDFIGEGDPQLLAGCSPYQAGDILWVRETWNGMCLDCQDCTREGYMYKADGTLGLCCPYEIKWCPSIHMPEEAARLFLRVNAVRVERLFDSFFAQGNTISALYDEGIDIGEQCRQCIEIYGNPCCNDLDPELEPDENGDDENGGSACGMLDEVRSYFAWLWNSRYEKPRPVKENGVITHYESYPWEGIRETRTYKGLRWEVYGNPWVWVTEFERISKEEALGGGGDG